MCQLPRRNSCIPFKKGRSKHLRLLEDMIAAEYLIMSFEVIQFVPGYIFSLVLQTHFYEFNQKCFSIVVCMNRMKDGGEGGQQHRSRQPKTELLYKRPAVGVLFFELLNNRVVPEEEYQQVGRTICLIRVVAAFQRLSKPGNFYSQKHHRGEKYHKCNFCCM